ncbi:hypothetical protein F6X40_27570 [Paraburkholderia sp. UCT31]|uniref:hypothetical protein n=1 Tax=Paraburkholderia sp. UCT31 TaxID=2615209 RepID=UPI0016563D1A|nr:hypothetical protein [Paraburkholderia sp. UCT31]MBC8740420.1 hypothetical protein [Paraburkholderia sp. UCT31]
MADSLTGTCFVPADVPLQEAVRRALKHFQNDNIVAALAGGSPWMKRTFQLSYQGEQVPVSLEDSVGTLEARVRAYLPQGTEWFEDKRRPDEVEFG